MRYFKPFYIVLIISMLAVTACGNTKETASELPVNVKPKSQTYFIFDTLVTVKVYDDRVTDRHFTEIHDLMKDIENKMSRTIETSDVAQINANAGKKAIHVSDETFYVIKTAKQYSEKSNGRFDVAIGSLVSLWNIGHEGAKVPPKAAIEENLKHIHYEKLVLDDAKKTIELTEEGMAVDLGAIAKGYAADRIAEYLLAHDFKSAIIDLGGNIFALGVKPNGDKWTIGVQDPNEKRGNPIGNMKIDNQTVVTSGVYERFFVENGVHYHHILDSTTGYPVVNELNSVTIVTNRSIDADALSTTVFALGLDKGMKFIEQFPDTEALFITKEKKVYMSSGMKDKFHMTNSAYILANEGGN